MNDLIIRAAKPDDAPDIAKLHIRSWQQAYRGIIHQSYLDHGLNFDEREKKWRNNLADSRKGTFLIFDGDLLAGFATVGQSRDQKFSDYYELYAIYLCPDYFGKGVGGKLLRHVLVYTIKCGFNKMFVNVLSENRLGRSFYERMGAIYIKDSDTDLKIDGRPYSEIKYEWKDLTLQTG